MRCWSLIFSCSLYVGAEKGIINHTMHYIAFLTDAWQTSPCETATHLKVKAVNKVHKVILRKIEYAEPCCINAIH